MKKTLAPLKIKFICNLVLSGMISIRGTARRLKISRNTVRKYTSHLNALTILYPAKENDLTFYIDKLKKSIPIRKDLVRLHEIFLLTSRNILTENSTVLNEWKAYKKEYPDGYQSSQFNSLFTEWCKTNGINKFKNRWKIESIAKKDLSILHKWRRSSNKTKWEKAVIILESQNGKSIAEISQKIERTADTVKKCIESYFEKGLTETLRKQRKQNELVTQNMVSKKANLMNLLHETPKLHNINRASWSIKTLGEAYKKQYCTYISSSTISKYIKDEGFSFRRAKETLTSPDPLFREKLKKITDILSNLTPKQKFFSVDEFGPLAIKIKGGKSYVRNGEQKTFSQLQKSKGCIICTAALELSENQITHFYSFKKNTEEMIKLLDILVEKYKDQEKLFFSWDAASWHASKKLYARIETVNHQVYRLKNRTPFVELAPLPSSAQFLNVIESVFSGLAKGIIHNSNYNSVTECKSAIDLYFDERNKHFQQQPKRAGNKIWGKEKVVPVFNETKNCKNPKWR